MENQKIRLEIVTRIVAASVSRVVLESQWDKCYAWTHIVGEAFDIADKIIRMNEIRSDKDHYNK